jgi:hypothetical protein
VRRFLDELHIDNFVNNYQMFNTFFDKPKTCGALMFVPGEWLEGYMAASLTTRTRLQSHSYKCKLLIQMQFTHPPSLRCDKEYYGNCTHTSIFLSLVRNAQDEEEEESEYETDTDDSDGGGPLKLIKPIFIPKVKQFG